MADEQKVEMVTIPRIKNTLGLGQGPDRNFYGPGTNVKMPKTTADKLGLKYEGVDEPEKAKQPEGDKYDVMIKADLEAELAKRNAERDEDDQIEVTGTGASGGIVKEDLLKALRDDDALNEK